MNKAYLEVIPTLQFSSNCNIARTQHQIKLRKKYFECNHFSQSQISQKYVNREGKEDEKNQAAAASKGFIQGSVVIGGLSKRDMWGRER